MNNRWIVIVLLFIFGSSLSGMVSAKDDNISKNLYGNQRQNIYPLINLSNGIPAWVYNYNNVSPTQENESKGAYVRSYDNTSHDGKIYYQTYSQGFTGVSVSTLNQYKKSRGSKRKNTPKTITYGTQMKK